MEIEEENTPEKKNLDQQPAEDQEMAPIQKEEDTNASPQEAQEEAEESYFRQVENETENQLPDQGSESEPITSFDETADEMEAESSAYGAASEQDDTPADERQDQAEPDIIDAKHELTDNLPPETYISAVTSGQETFSDTNSTKETSYDEQAAGVVNPLEASSNKKGGFRFRHNSFLGLFTHLLIMLAVSTLMVLAFFLVYLPITTKHSENITVPNLEGLHLDSAKVLLTQLDLRLEVYDSSATNFTKDVPSLTILDQDPPYNGKVKRNRIIYLTVNPVTPPMVLVPNVKASSVKNTQIRFKSLGLNMKIKYIQGDYPNTVERLEYEGKEITKEMIDAGFMLPKGSQIQLYVNSGAGKEQQVTIPNLVGMPIDEAEWLLQGMGLAIGKITYVTSTDLSPGTVVFQSPSPENQRSLLIGSTVAVALAKAKEPVSTPENK